jgi:hypothetical protein
MCPGLTHKNVVEELAKNPVENNTPVAIMAEVPYVPPQALASPELLTSSLKRSRCPRMLTSPPARVQDKKHALAIGHTQMSSADIIETNKGASTPAAPAAGAGARRRRRAWLDAAAR